MFINLCYFHFFKEHSSNISFFFVFVPVFSGIHPICLLVFKGNNTAALCVLGDFFIESNIDSRVKSHGKQKKKKSVLL